MRALVVYESMYGNTHLVANQIAAGLRTVADVRVVPVGDATPETLSGVDLLIVGGPTHIHTVTTSKSRRAAIEAAAKPGAELTIDPDAEGLGLRDWFDALDPSATTAKAAAFDTRLDGAAMLTGRASRGIAHRLSHHGLEVIAPPESFLVNRDNHLVAGVADAAEAWGAALGHALRAGAT
jgi:hypothetical protein